MALCTECDHEDDETLCSCEIDRQMAYWYSLYRGEKAAGLLKTKDEIADDLRLAGRGHLAR